MFGITRSRYAAISAIAVTAALGAFTGLPTDASSQQSSEGSGYIEFTAAEGFCGAGFGGDGHPPCNGKVVVGSSMAATLTYVEMPRGGQHSINTIQNRHGGKFNSIGLTRFDYLADRIRENPDPDENTRWAFAPFCYLAGMTESLGDTSGGEHGEVAGVVYKSPWILSTDENHIANKTVQFGAQAYYHSACLVQNNCPENHSYEGSPHRAGKVFWTCWHRSTETEDSPSGSRTTTARIYERINEFTPIVRVADGLYSLDKLPEHSLNVHSFWHRYFYVHQPANGDNRLDACEEYLCQDYVCEPEDWSACCLCDYDGLSEGARWQEDWDEQVLKWDYRGVVEDDMRVHDHVDQTWDVCMGAVPDSPCPCYGPIRIAEQVPDIEYICKNCDMEFTRVETCRTTKWEVVEGAEVVEPPHQGYGASFELSTKDVPNKGFFDDMFTDITIRLSDASEPLQYDERTIKLWVPPNNSGRAGKCPLCVNPKESAFALVYPECAAAINLHIAQAFMPGGPMQELWGWDDDPCSDENRIGNAFLHAWLVCKAAQSGSCISVLNGPGLLGPLEYWFLHEEYTKNTCTQAAMDFHNDQQGYAVGLGSTEDCTDLVLDAMAAGNLRWRDADTPACRWELDAEDHECWPE